MSAEGEYRRIIPSPGQRRPGVFAILVRWRVELLLLAMIAGLWRMAGGLAVGLVVAALSVGTVLVPPIRRMVSGAIRTVVVPHRVRAGLVQAGIGDRAGRPPWLLWARPIGLNGVLVGVWLRAGTTAGDLREATQVIAAACGATAVEVEQYGDRSDRVRLHVVRPQWGWPGR